MPCPTCGVNHATGPRGEAIRFGRSSPTQRTRFGPCHSCNAPEDQWCYPTCQLHDPWMPPDQRLKQRAIKSAELAKDPGPGKGYL